MKQAQTRNAYRVRRHLRLRKKVTGTAERPRLSVFRSLLSMYAQLIDDTASKTLIGVSSKMPLSGDAGDRVGKVKQAYLLGRTLAEQAKEKQITTVVFDRGGFNYRGRIAAFADGARDGGLIF
jgi:large subunit ribosomal protein L18